MSERDRYLIIDVGGEHLLVDTNCVPALTVLRLSSSESLPVGFTELVRMANLGAPARKRVASTGEHRAAPRRGLQIEVLRALVELGVPSTFDDVATVLDHPADSTSACLSQLWKRGWADWTDSVPVNDGRSARRLYVITELGIEALARAEQAEHFAERGR